MPYEPLDKHRSIVRRPLISGDDAACLTATIDGPGQTSASSHAHYVMTMHSINARYSA
jgi:hypothetical protein